jgi:flagellar basal body P-ring formation protein FlgA
VVDKIKSVSALNKGHKIIVEFDTPHFSLNLPKGQPAAFILSNFAYDERGRRFHTDIIAGSQDQPTSVSVSGRVFVQREIPVLSRRMEAGAILAQSDLSFTTAEVDRIPADAILSASDLIGREVAADVAEGMPLRARDVRPPRLILRGSLVTMRIETPTMLVTAQGRALQEGAMGDTVRVLNTRSNRLIEGRVTAAGIVDIAINQMDAPMRNAKAENNLYRQ